MDGWKREVPTSPGWYWFWDLNHIGQDVPILLDLRDPRHFPLLPHMDTATCWYHPANLPNHPLAKSPEGTSLQEMHMKARPNAHAIFDTDMTQPMSVLIEQLRSKLTKTRGMYSDIRSGWPGWGSRIDYVEGTLTALIVALHSSKAEIVEAELLFDDEQRGTHLKFDPRGIGMDECPCCFVCKQHGGLMDNIAAFVKSKEDGEKIVAWFEHCARLDYRPSEPNWIQVKVGTCKEYLPALEHLGKLTSVHGVIREMDVLDSREQCSDVR